MQHEVERSLRSLGTVVLRPVDLSDPIVQLGESPVACGLDDASENHDKYLTDIEKLLEAASRYGIEIRVPQE